MDYFDDKRLRLAYTFYKDNLPKEIIIQIINTLYLLRSQHNDDNIKYQINDWIINFDDGSFDMFYPDTKLQILRQAEKKYGDFDDIIHRASGQMKSKFSESGKSKLYANGYPTALYLKHATIEKNNNGTHTIKFVIILKEDGKRGSVYYHSAGKISVNL